MKRIFIICISLIFITGQLSAQAAADTLYLKNGSIVYGKLHIKSRTQYEIRTTEGFLFNFSSQEVEKYIKGQFSPLEKANKNISSGKAFTAIGSIAIVTGCSMIYYSSREGLYLDNTSISFFIGIGLVCSGIGSLATGIPKWINGGNKKKSIEIEMVSFKSPVSAPVSGVGIKIRF
jgi:hypothetical protein